MEHSSSSGSVRPSPFASASAASSALRAAAERLRSNYTPHHEPPDSQAPTTPAEPQGWGEKEQKHDPQ
jgi:hypothetical protein